jgi:hypothetical protein
MMPAVVARCAGCIARARIERRSRGAGPPSQRKVLVASLGAAARSPSPTPSPTFTEQDLMWERHREHLRGQQTCALAVLAAAAVAGVLLFLGLRRRPALRLVLLLALCVLALVLLLIGLHWTF